MGQGQADLNHHDADDANAGLDRQCGDGAPVENGFNFYSITGCVVAYFCHLYTVQNQRTVWCSASDRAAASEVITTNCGYYRPGFLEIIVKDHVDGGPDVRHTVRHGYENYCTDMGQNFCGTGV